MFEGSISKPAPSLERALSALGLKAYTEQITMSGHLDRVYDKGGVGFIEAPTATGKTLVIAQHVLDHVANTRERYVIAVPTIEIGHQTLNAVHRIQSTSPALAAVKAGIILGRQEFVSEVSLSDLSEVLAAQGKTDAAAAIRAWLEDGAPGRTADHPKYTMDGLERWFDKEGVQEDLSPVLALGPADKGSDADNAYQAQFDDFAEILIVSHAMLARDLITRFIATSKERRELGMKLPGNLTPAERWLIANDQRLECETGDEGRLPDYRRLIVDEAHLLRDNFDSAFRSSISITSLVRNVEKLSKSAKKPVPSATLKQIRSIRSQIMALPDAESGERIQINWNNPGSYGSIIEKLDEALRSIKLSKALEHESEVVAINQARYSIREALRARSAVSTIFEWSPIAAFPSISVGRRHLSSEMNFFWSRLISASLVSATLYTENVSGPSIGYTASRLAVPENLRKEFKPIKATWLLKPVSVIMPDKNDSRLNPSDDPADREEWLNNLAAKIASYSMEARGSLILNTRRSDSHELAERLKKITDPARIIDGTTARMSALKQTFIQSAREGLAPIWLAQGPAWTGLDIPDDCLEFLAITRLPFPQPDAKDTHRESSPIYGANKIAKMAMTFKQGIGRLVRSRGAGPKTFAMLDSRVLTLKNARGVLTLLSKYAGKR